MPLPHLSIYNDRVKGEIIILVEILSERLFELRKKNNLNQDEVADIIGVGRSTYGNYEQGTREMDYITLLKLADFYKVSLDYMFGRSDFPFVKKSYSPDEIEFMEKAISLYKEVKAKYR